jgi:hypothetical protein
MSAASNLVLADLLPYLGRTPQALDLIKIGLLKQILLYLNPNAVTDPNELLEEMRCYACLSQSQLDLISINLLSQIADDVSAMDTYFYDETTGIVVGGVPTVVPITDVAICLTNDGTLWTYYSGAWH